MAQIYNIICPKCGKKFEVMKGILMSECEKGDIPAERKEETPFKCPHCRHQMSVQDPNFNDHVESVIKAD